jgi:histone deacetylase 6
MPSGFCFLNNVVLAARTLLAAGKRVAILDWDYHFGDGTANALWGEEAVMFVSLHAAQSRSGFPTYPANNARDMKGGGLRKRSKGRSFNVQWPVDDADDAAYAYAFRRLILPALHQFSPDVIIVSAGYDAIRGDSLAGMELTAEAFGFMARALTTLELPVLCILEGGYDVHLLASGVANTILGLQHSPLFNSFEEWLSQEPAKVHRETVEDVACLVLNGPDLTP